MRALLKTWRIWWARRFGRRCYFCSGRGSYHSHITPAYTFGPYRLRKCGHCTSGWMIPEQVAAAERYEEFWRSGRFARGDVTLEQLDRGDWQP